MNKLMFLLPLTMGLLACTQTGQNKKAAAKGKGAKKEIGEIEQVAQTEGSGSLIAPYPPKDLPRPASDDQLAEFAWREFFALVWKSSYAKDGKRDNPDTSWSFKTDSSSYPNLVVWETYAHRSELRPYNDSMLSFDTPPHYSFGEALKPSPGSGAVFTLFNNLDENNEIGSCDVYAQVDKYDRDKMVLYQAKVNRDEYDYILNNYSTKNALLKATTNTYNNIQKDTTYYPGSDNTCNCPESEDVICLPCGNSPIPGGTGTYQGTMEIKTAWRLLTPEDNPEKFFKRKVVYYEKVGDSAYYNNKEFALIGIHIIHKTTNYPDYIFATWEHVSVENDNMGYVLLDSNGEETGPLYKNYPRLHKIPAVSDRITTRAHTELKSMNPNSIWLNYRLVGVQGAATSDSTTTNFFLANYVIESDTTLADFHGSNIGSPHNRQDNVLYKKEKFSMGGCKGCHGVAQLTLGTDFSFLLDTVGKPIFAPDIYDEFSESKKSKLFRYMKATMEKMK